jgi:CxxC motif-containing protein
MNNIEISCNICPIKCKITVRTTEDGEIKRTTGYGCTRGKNLAIDRVMYPREVFTGEVKVNVGNSVVMLPVTTTRPIPREALSYAEDILTKISPMPPIKKGESIIIDFVDRGVNLIALEDVE